MSAARPVLCVDLDGTLVRTDTLKESLIALLRRRPWLLIALPWWLMRGRTHFKAKVAAFDFDPSDLPYNEDLVAYLRAERATGRRVVLATASHVLAARRIANHLGLFDAVHATEGHINCKGAAKADVLAKAYGERGFVYAGDSRADLAVWRLAHSAIVVDAPRGVRDALDGVPIEREFVSGASRTASTWKLMRPHQWVKNALVAVPLLTAHRYGDPHAVAATIIAFIATCIAASAIYVVNDLLDVHADRRHATKRARPLAAGTLPLGWAMTALPLLAVAAAVAAMPLPRGFGLALAGYAAAAIGYSLAVKHVAWLDALWLAGLYTLRIYLGALAISVPVSGWLAAFSLFAFASLALLKRFTEIQSLAAREGATRARGYRVADARRVEVAGWACALVAAGVLVFYFTSATVQTLYRDPRLLWGVAPLLLYLLLEVWRAARAGRMHEDPVWYAIRRPMTYVVLGAVLALMLLAR
jgi:4-hydroxybenzoate polyprenyltransferase/phosphoserine phosphatase